MSAMPDSGFSFGSDSSFAGAEADTGRSRMTNRILGSSRSRSSWSRICIRPLRVRITEPLSPSRWRASVGSMESPTSTSSSSTVARVGRTIFAVPGKCGTRYGRSATTSCMHITAWRGPSP